MQTIPDALEKDVTSRNQTHALKKRTGRMPCAYSFIVTDAFTTASSFVLTDMTASHETTAASVHSKSSTNDFGLYTIDYILYYRRAVTFC